MTAETSTSIFSHTFTTPSLAKMMQQNKLCFLFAGMVSFHPVSFQSSSESFNLGSGSGLMRSFPKAISFAGS